MIDSMLARTSQGCFGWTLRFLTSVNATGIDLELLPRQAAYQPLVE